MQQQKKLWNFHMLTQTSQVNEYYLINCPENEYFDAI